MRKKGLRMLLCLLIVSAVLPVKSAVLASGTGTRDEHIVAANASELFAALASENSGRVYIQLDADIISEGDGAFGPETVRGFKSLDLNGHTVKSKLPFYADKSSFSLFVIESGASLTLLDSAGGGEIVYDRYVPSMGETNAFTDLILDRPLTVFDVYGTLTVNGGEITAGHYESEYYTFTKKYNTGGGTSPDTVHSITPGSAVVVRDGGRFTSNGGEYFGRGFTIDDNGEKQDVCAAVMLRNGSAAIINDGRFFGKSNADVFSVGWGANVFVYSGLFLAEYDSRITVDKTNGTAFYVNVDCGKIGLPLRAFDHAGRDRVSIQVGSQDYAFSSDFSDAESTAFENLGADGTGVTVTVSPKPDGVSRIERLDGSTARFTYCPLEHVELVCTDAAYFSDSFAAIPSELRTRSYSWLVERQDGASWTAAAFLPEVPVIGNRLSTQSSRLDLYDLARYLSGGMEDGARYRVTARSAESWNSAGTYITRTESGNSIEFDREYEDVGEIDLPDSETGIEWPEYGKNAKNLSLERDAFTMSLTFQEVSADGTRWATMSERNTFSFRRSYRLLVRITPKAFYRVDPYYSVYLGDKRVQDKALDGAALTGVIPLEVLPGRIESVTVQGSVTEGCKLYADTPLRSVTPYVTVSTAWFKGDTEVTGGTASYGDYRARIMLKAQTSYALSAETTVEVFGKTYPVTDLSADGSVGYVNTDPQSVACSHGKNTNAYSFDADEHHLVCSVCGAELSRAAHTMGSWTVNGDRDVRTCSVCGYQESTSNGRQRVPHIRLTGDVPFVGDTLSTVEVYSADAKYAALEHAAEWYRDELKHSASVPADAVMEDGHVYYAFVKFNVADCYYFDDDTEVVTLNPAAAATEQTVGDSRHLEAVLAFTPRTVATVEFTLGERKESQTYGAFLAGFAASVDGKAAPFAVAVDWNGSPVASLDYNNESGSWQIASGDLEEFAARAMEPDGEYRVLVTTTEEGNSFDVDRITVNNAKAADKAELAADDSGCAVTAYYRRKAGTPPIATDFNGTGETDAADVSMLLIHILSGDAPEEGWDVNGDGETDCLDALTLLKDAVEDVDIFVAAAYDAQGKLTDLRLIDLSKELDAADLTFLKTAEKLCFFYLNGDSAPSAEAFAYSLKS